MVALIVAGCSTPSGYQPISAPGGRVQIAEDASVAPPAGEGWMMQRTTHETGDEVLFARDVTAKPTRAEDDHTLRVVFSVQRAIGSAPHDQAFQNFGFRQQRNTEGGRLTNISYTSTHNDFGGADCLRYEASTEDRGVSAFPGAVFTLTNDGMLCFHPSRPVVVIVDWSERFLAGQTAVAPPPQVDDFLESLRFLGDAQPSAAAAPAALAGPVLLSDRFSSASHWLTADNEYVRAEFTSDGYAVEFKRDDAGVFRTSAPGGLAQNVRIEAAVIASPVRGTRVQRYGIICSAQLSADADRGKETLDLVIGEAKQTDVHARRVEAMEDLGQVLLDIVAPLVVVFEVPLRLEVRGN